MPNQTALIVDDEPSVRRFLHNILRQESFEILEAEGGIPAFEIVRERSGRIDLLVSDVRMPAGDGLTLARSVREIYPAIPILLISGLPDHAKSKPHLCEFALLPKPFRSEMFREAVRKMVKKPNSKARTAARE